MKRRVRRFEPGLPRDTNGPAFAGSFWCEIQARSPRVQSVSSGFQQRAAPTLPNYGLPSFTASIGTFTFTSLISAVNRPSSHRNEYLNGNLIPFTSR